MICHPLFDLSSRAKRGICSLLATKQITRKFGNAEGAEIAEAALVLPLVFMLLLGIIWFGRAFNIYSTIQQAAQQGAITAARATCVTCAGGNTFPTDATVTGAVEAVMKASSIDTTQIKTWNPGLAACPPPAPPGGGCPPPTSDNITICRNVQLNPAGQPLQCGTVVSFQYPFQFVLPFTSLNMQKITLSAQAQSRMEN